MRFFRFAAFVVVGLLPSIAHSQAATEEEAAANRQRPFVEGKAALDQYVISDKCASPQASKAKANIAELERTEGDLRGLPSLEGMADEVQQMHTALAFAFADAALKKKCLDDADQVYRSLIRFYEGESYSGIRDRAKMGVDDVRALRK